MASTVCLTELRDHMAAGPRTRFEWYPPSEQMRGTGVNLEHPRLQHQRIYYDVLTSFAGDLEDEAARVSGRVSRITRDTLISAIAALTTPGIEERESAALVWRNGDLSTLRLLCTAYIFSKELGGEEAGRRLRAASRSPERSEVAMIEAPHE